ncbi:MAG: tetratricopeptide repeat protein, partial [Cystobacter sp.]
GRDPRPTGARAEAMLRQALASNPAHAEAWYFLGEAVGAQALFPGGTPQGLEEAVHAFEKGLGLAPERPEFLLGYGHFLRRQALRFRRDGRDPGPSLERGLALARQLLAARPDWPDARILRGALLALRGEAPPRRPHAP